MARKRVYIKPFLSDGTYGNWVDVSDDVYTGQLATINQQLDNSDYDIGIFTNSGVGLQLRNDSGKYSDVGQPYSIFLTRRADSLVKFTWNLADFDHFAGLSQADDFLGNEVVVFTGIINDDSSTMDAPNDQPIQFQVLGFESIFDRVPAPNWAGTPPSDNKCSTLIKAILAQVAAYGSVGSNIVPDNSQVNPGNDVAFDVLTSFVNQTCKEALTNILTACDSVLYFNGNTPVVSARTPGAVVQKHFYGPASSAGRENIITITNIFSGLNKTFNYVTWTDGNNPPTINEISQDQSSVAALGARKKNVTVPGITTLATVDSIIAAIKTEFANPKQELILKTPIEYSTLALALLNKVDIDFPLVPVGQQPLYGVAIYGVDQYPITLSAFSVDTTTPYKILGIEVDLAGDCINFTLRKI